MWGSSASDVYAVGYHGNFLHWNGSSLGVSTPFGTGTTFNDIYGTAADDIYMVGSAGTAYHYDGLTWSAINTGTTSDLYGVYALSPSQVMISGLNGTLLMGNGTSFTPIPSGTTRHLFGIYGLQNGNTDYWWVGASGVGRTEGGVILAGTATVRAGVDGAEPATLTLMATGLATMAAVRRRRRST